MMANPNPFSNNPARRLDGEREAALREVDPATRIAIEGFKAERTAYSAIGSAGLRREDVAFIRHEPAFGLGSLRLIGVNNADGGVRSALVRECASQIIGRDVEGSYRLTAVEFARLGAKWTALLTAWQHPDQKDVVHKDRVSELELEGPGGETRGLSGMSATIMNDWPSLDSPIGFTVPDFNQFGDDRSEQRERMAEYAAQAEFALKRARLFKGVHYDDIQVSDEPKLEVIAISGELEAIAIQQVLIRELHHFSSFCRYPRANWPLTDKYEVVAYCPSSEFTTVDGLLVPKPIRLDLFARINRFDVTCPEAALGGDASALERSLEFVRVKLRDNGIMLPHCEISRASTNSITIRFDDGRPMLHTATGRSMVDVLDAITEAAFRYQSVGSSNIMQ
ncbi:MAG: hypothetical protein QY326_02800 [Bdellovibrionota bacterium]|nr:MAG: hypothetical protein QY326_02800 [Bdellovibrionota bacterium]